MIPLSLYESVFNSSPTGNYLLSPSPDPVILAVNDVFLQATSRTRDDLVGTKLFVAFPENQDDSDDTGLAVLRASLASVIATGKPNAMPLQRYPIWVTKPNGETDYEERFWSAVNTPIVGPDGELLCISHCTTDVTQQAQAEAALRKSEKKYRDLFNSIDEGFCTIEMLFDEQGQPIDYRFCETNPAFSVQTGLHDAAGKRMLELALRIEDYWFDMYGRVARTGEPVRFENEAKALNRWFDVHASRTDEPGGNRVAVLFKDITDKKLSEEALRLNEQLAHQAARQAADERNRLTTVLEAVPIGIVVSDVNGAISLANAANKRLWGEQHPDAKGIEEFDKWKGWWADGSERHGQRLAPHDWTTARILRGEEALHDVIEIESFDVPPVRRICLNSGAPIKDIDGKITGAVVAQLNITDRIKAEEALRQGDRRKDEFLAMLAHELRNPLAPISAAADLLSLDHLDAPRVKQASSIISRQVRHMTSLVDDLLDVSRVTRGLVTLDKVNLDAKKIVADAVEQVRPLIEKGGHRLAVHTPPESAFVLGDQKRLVQVVTNILNNSAKYTPEGGTIVLGMEVDDYVRITITDNGIGMALDLVGRAFEMFAQAERTPDRAQGGLGIGLALVKSLVVLHGGTIEAYSEGVGKGSRFTLSLKHSKELRCEPRPKRGLIPEALPSQSLKIMVVDDNADAAQMLGVFVELLGHHVFVEHGSIKALERAKKEMPDVCLLDIGLPEMDGNELARRLRDQPETAKAVLVAVTGYGQEHDRINALGAGFDHHFIKPIDNKKLAKLLSDIKLSK